MKGRKRRKERERENGRNRADEVGAECRGFFLHDFPPSITGAHVHHRTRRRRRLRPRGGGGLEAANAKRAPRAILPPHGIRALPPPPAGPRSGGRRGWDAATTPTLRNHLYLVDVTTYHPLSGGGSGGGDGGGGLLEKRLWKWRTKERKERRRRPRRRRKKIMK